MATLHERKVCTICQAKVIVTKVCVLKCWNRREVCICEKCIIPIKMQLQESAAYLKSVKDLGH